MAKLLRMMKLTKKRKVSGRDLRKKSKKKRRRMRIIATKIVIGPRRRSRDLKAA